jgi:prolyl 4-hydroxylase
MSCPTETPELALVEQHDAAGRHSDAIDVLARATSAGNLTCMTQLGKRLLVGDRSPPMGAEGASFLRDAALRGEPEAAARMATLTALGLYFNQSWQDALRWLSIAAERHWTAAKGQLLALAEATAAIDTADAAMNRSWQQLASRIDTSAWHKAPLGRDLSVDPLIRVLDSFVTPAVCEWMIARSRNCLTRARVYDPVKRQDVVRGTRTNSVANFNLAQTELLDVLLQAKMASACGIAINHMEAPAVLHYDVGEEATNHFDFVNPNTPDYEREIASNGQRVLTFLVYLNDGYEGGETAFPTLGLCHKGRRGQGLFFVNSHVDLQPDLRMLHAGRAPLRGEKWIVSQFIRSRATLVPIPLGMVY